VLGQPPGVEGVAVGGDDGGVALQSEDRRGLADVVGATDQDQVEPVIGGGGVASGRGGVAVEHVEGGGGCRGHEARHPQRQQAGVEGVQGLDVLERR
jgi:hypothetical protein